MQAQTNPNEDTEFNDALRAHGILPPKPPSRSPSPEPPEASEVRNAQLKQATVADLDEEIDLLADDGKGNDEEEKRLIELRRRRMQDLIKEQKKGKFGRVYPIARQDYTREVTDASKEPADGQSAQEEREEEERQRTKGTSVNEEQPQRKGTGVVCFLYNDALETCRLLSGFLDTLAAKYPATKFVSIVGDKCIPNYPDKNLPTMLIYRNGELHRQIVGLRPEIGLDGMKTKLEDIELLLLAVGVIERSTVPGSSSYEPGLQFKDPKKNPEEGEDQDEDEGFGGNRTKTKPTIRSQEEEDAELDWDL
ncbi:thioredoxin-like protein [Meira miltonrushii]|uniref:Thioredoxin-like protein n=1 Tax=Meira miltonrushii TaxID=1280837 RepID=A0A316V1N1_9BASI|nr:thioredoxin-like protein [Meira miltonrushii]PWN31457.1 thioredoxin-like protein [Meira miltonrushii]